MIETNLRKIVNEYSEIIVSIKKIEMVEEEQVAKLKAKLKLFDETILWIREIWKRGRWLNIVIIGCNPMRL